MISSSKNLVSISAATLRRTKPWNNPLQLSFFANLHTRRACQSPILLNQDHLRLNNKCLFKQSYLFYSSAANQQYKLVEVGTLESVRTENYQPGQLFLHKVFGYRGVILFPWTANLFDKTDETANETGPSFRQNQKTIDLAKSSSEISSSNSSSSYDKAAAEDLSRGPPERNKAKKITYYQVLIDNRDIPYIRAQPESVTFLSSQENNRAVYSIHGLDYVSQNDVIPYTSTEKIPIVHDLFDKFLMPDPSSSKTGFMPRESLKSWQDRNHPWLELSDVCTKITNNIRVTVIPFYIGVKEDQRKKVYWWRYSIRIENLSPNPVTLRERNWRIFGQAGTFETVKGKGVIGQEPYLNSDYPAFQYSSHVNLQSPSGHMWGTYKMEREDGTTFEVRIPSFYLECKEEDKPFNPFQS